MPGRRGPGAGALVREVPGDLSVWSEMTSATPAAFRPVPLILVAVAVVCGALACRMLGLGEGVLLVAAPASGMALAAALVLRWKGAVTLRAEGGFAPVVVQPGVMGNPGPLVVSPHHRLFLYRRDARNLTGAAGLLVQARHLVDDSAILRREGGHVEYFSLVFDAHEVIYAEGVPCESLMVCPSVLTRLPEDLAAPLRAAFPGLSQRLHSGADLAPEMVSRLPDRPGARLPLRP